MGTTPRVGDLREFEYIMRCQNVTTAPRPSSYGLRALQRPGLSLPIEAKRSMPRYGACDPLEMQDNDQGEGQQRS